MRRREGPYKQTVMQCALGNIRLGSFAAASWRGADPHVMGGPMHSLSGDVEHWLTETPRLPTPVVLLAGLLALNIASAVLALLAA